MLPLANSADALLATGRAPRNGCITGSRSLKRTLALQLRSVSDVGFSCGGLMGSSPDRPSDHMSRVNAALRQAHRDTPDLLDRPADQSTGRRALVLVFGGGNRFAWWRT